MIPAGIMKGVHVDRAPTWEDLAEGAEMVAKAMSIRVFRGDVPTGGKVWRTRVKAAMLDDAAVAVAHASSFRRAHAEGAPLDPALARLVAFEGTL